MTRELRRRLEAERDAAIREAAERLLANSGEDVGDHVGRIDTYSKLLAAMPRDRMRQGLIAAVVSLICVSAVGLAWALRVPETKIILAVQGEAIALKLTEPWAWSEDLSINPDSFRLEELTMLELPAPGSVIERLEGSAWAQVEAGQATLTRLELGEGGDLRVETGDNGIVAIYTRGAVFSGDLTVLGTTKVSAGAQSVDGKIAYRLELSFPETILFRADGQSAVPAQLRIRPKEDFVLNDLRVQSLSFSRDRSDRPGTQIFVSTITGGTVLLSDISETVELQRGEPLSLEGVRGRVTQIRVDDQIDVRFEGVAEEVHIGPAGFERDLAPTLLQYLYHKQRLPFFWSAVTFLWGLLWSVRKLLFPER